MTYDEDWLNPPAKTRVAVVTGASRGIGARLAQALAERGFAVGATSDDAAGLAALRASLPAARLATAPADVRDPAAVAAAMAHFHAELGAIDLLINVAGVAYFGGVERCTAEEWQKTFDVNVGGYFHACKAALPYLQAGTDAQIINMSSVWAHDGAPTMAAYAASKHAVEGLTSSLRKELAPRGIKVSSLVLDKVDTPFRDNMAADVSFDEAQRQRMLSTQDVADAVLYLAHCGKNCLPSTLTLDAWRWQ